MSVRGRLAAAVVIMAAGWAFAASAATLTVSGIGSDGWYSDDTRGPTGTDLVGLTLTHYGKPGQTPMAADDTAIASQIKFTASAPGTRSALMLTKTSAGGNSKCTISKVDPAGFVASAGGVPWTAGFSMEYAYYTASNVELPVPKLGIRSPLWASSQAGFTAIRSGESAWDLVLVDVRGTTPGWTIGSWATFLADTTTPCWVVYRQGGNAFFNPMPAGWDFDHGKSLAQIAAMNNPANPDHVAKVIGATTYTWADVLLGDGAKVVTVEIGVGSSTQTSTGYIDYLKLSFLNGGDKIDFSGTVYVNAVTGNDTTGDGSAANPYKTIGKGVTMAGTGAVVQVAAGTYNEQVTISKPLTVNGADGAVLDGTGLAPTWTTGVKIKSGNVTFNNIDVTKFTQDGIICGYEASVPGGLPNIHITNCKITDIQPGYWGFGIYVGYESEGFVYSPPKLTSHLDYSGLLIEGNEIGNVADVGLVLQSISGTPGTLVVRNNYVRDCTASRGIWVECARNILIESNKVVGNLRGIEFLAIPEHYNIPSYTLKTPYLVDGPYSSKDITLRGNLVYGNTWQGVALFEAWPSTIVMEDNAIVGNGLGGVANRMAATVDVSGNWWGDLAGPLSGLSSVGLGDRVSGTLSFAPVLTMPAFANVLYLEPTAPSFYVKPTETCVVDLKVANLQQPVSALQAMLQFSSTYFKSGPSDVAVAEGGGDWDELIYDVWNTTGALDVAVGVQLIDGGGAGTVDDATTAIITLNPAGPEGVTTVVFRPDADPDPGLVASTFLSMPDGTVVMPAKVPSANIVIDGTVPVISSITAIESQPMGVLDVKNCANVTLQGLVNVAVASTDTLAGLVAPPAVTITGPGALTANYVSESPAGTFNYGVLVDALTVNGTYTAQVVATDRAGNATTNTFTLCVNKNQIGVTVELEQFVGATRTVTFVCSGGTPKTYTVAVSNFAAAVGTCVLRDVPEGTTALSAKTAWSLREKMAVTLVDGQATASFVRDGTPGWSDATDHYLRGGDFNESNSINIQDYSLLRGAWLTTNPAIDINGNGAVNTVDYGLMQGNWFKVGDAQ